MHDHEQRSADYELDLLELDVLDRAIHCSLLLSASLLMTCGGLLFAAQ